MRNLKLGIKRQKAAPLCEPVDRLFIGSSGFSGKNGLMLLNLGTPSPRRAKHARLALRPHAEARELVVYIPEECTARLFFMISA
jgi:hypothetical protein